MAEGVKEWLETPGLHNAPMKA